MKHLDNDYKLNSPQSQCDVSKLRDFANPTNLIPYTITKVHAPRDTNIYGNITINNPCMINKSFLGLD